MDSLYFAAFLVAFATSFGATPLSIWLANKYGVLDQPDARKVHKAPIPRWGGLAIYAGVMMSVVCLFAGFRRFRKLLDYRHSLYDNGK